MVSKKIIEFLPMEKNRIFLHVIQTIMILSFPPSFLMHYLSSTFLNFVLPDAWMTRAGISGAQPALRMKAQTDSNSRDQKDLFVKNLVVEKRRERLHIRECRGTWKPVIPWVRGREWGFIAFLHCLRAEMPFRCRQVFPREEKCLPDLLWSVFQDPPLNGHPNCY
jgi:hypothetical protein